MRPTKYNNHEIVKALQAGETLLTVSRKFACSISHVRNLKKLACIVTNTANIPASYIPVIERVNKLEKIVEELSDTLDELYNKSERLEKELSKLGD